MRIKVVFEYFFNRHYIVDKRQTRTNTLDLGLIYHELELMPIKQPYGFGIQKHYRGHNFEAFKKFKTYFFRTPEKSLPLGS